MVAGGCSGMSERLWLVGAGEPSEHVSIYMYLYDVPIVEGLVILTEAQTAQSPVASAGRSIVLDPTEQNGTLSRKIDGRQLRFPSTSIEKLYTILAYTTFYLTHAPSRSLLVASQATITPEAACLTHDQRLLVTFEKTADDRNQARSHSLQSHSSRALGSEH